MYVKSYLYNCSSCLSIIIFSLLGCQFMNDNHQKDNSKSYCFSSPAEAVPIITELLQKKNFKVLSRYYDLSNSEIKLSDLESGDFFILPLNEASSTTKMHKSHKILLKIIYNLTSHITYHFTRTQCPD